MEINIHNKQLKKAVKDYYDWHGESKAVPAAVIKNKKSDFKLLLVHFKDEEGREMSSFMICQPWNDGHWDVEEVEDCLMEDEREMITWFEESQEYV